MEDIVGFGFRPTDEELVGYYLHNKILGQNLLVQEFISEVNISDFDPWNLRCEIERPCVVLLSGRGSNGDRQNRRTSSGFWKITGHPVEVKDQWGTWCGVKGKIGYKRVLVFRRGKSSSSQSTKSDWVMHEYHYTLLPEDQQPVVPYDDNTQTIWDYVIEENFSRHQPKKPVTGFWSMMAVMLILTLNLQVIMLSSKTNADGKVA
ncbi:NAC domain-containing protein 1 [Raphanus sativus]|nr:NAC domain-containing protein 1 [Raphanus sativus]